MPPEFPAESNAFTQSLAHHVKSIAVYGIEASAEIARLEKELAATEDLSERLEAMTAERDAARINLAKANAQIRALAEEVNEWVGKHETAAAEVINLTGSLEQHRAHIEHLETEAIAHAEEILTLRARIAELEGEPAPEPEPVVPSLTGLIFYDRDTLLGERMTLGSTMTRERAGLPEIFAFKAESLGAVDYVVFTIGTVAGGPIREMRDDTWPWFTEDFQDPPLNSYTIDATGFYGGEPTNTLSVVFDVVADGTAPVEPTPEPDPTPGADISPRGWKAMVDSMRIEGMLITPLSVPGVVTRMEAAYHALWSFCMEALRIGDPDIGDEVASHTATREAWAVTFQDAAIEAGVEPVNAEEYPIAIEIQAAIDAAGA